MIENDNTFTRCIRFENYHIYIIISCISIIESISNYYKLSVTIRRKRLERKHAPDKSRLLLLEIGFRTRELTKYNVGVAGKQPIHCLNVRIIPVI